MERNISFSNEIFAKHTALKAICFLGAIGLLAAGLAPNTQAATYSREQDVVDLKLGQRVRVDDGTCLPGQVKEVSGAKMTETGVMRSAKCIPRIGIKHK